VTQGDLGAERLKFQVDLVAFWVEFDEVVGEADQLVLV
jgi:hypothetical protein